MIMDYETEIIDGRKAIVRHIFKAHEIEVGSRGLVLLVVL